MLRERDMELKEGTSGKLTAGSSILGPKRPLNLWGSASCFSTLRI
jgi:hypothetical protein